jgi:multidrug efflux system membrane fusion protein
MIMQITFRFLRPFMPLTLAIALAGCDREPPVAKPDPVEVAVSQPIKDKVAEWDVFTGTVDARESVDIRARVRGEIKDMYFEEGEEIEAGKLLYKIDADPFTAALKQAEGQLDTWQAKLKAAKAKIDIYKPLADKGTVAKDELISAYAAEGEASGGIDVARGKIMEANTNIGYCTIKAPIAGKIGEAMLTKGNIANSTGQDNLLATIISVDPLYVTFYVNDRQLLTYQKIVRERFEKDKKEIKGEFPVEMALAVDSDFPYKGSVDFIDNKVDPNTGAIKVRARFDNHKGPDGRRPLTVGLFARVRVSVADPYQAMLVADRAILSDQSLKYVLVVNKAKNNVVERVDVTVSSRLQADGTREVEAGLKGDEWIIVDGVNRARPGVTVTPKEVPMPRRQPAKA